MIRTLVQLCGLVLLAAGAAKIADLTSFTLLIFTLLPGGVKSENLSFVAALIVILFEVEIGVALLIIPRARFALMSGLVLMLVLTGFLLRIWLDPAVEECGCFGVSLLTPDWLASPPIALLRNFLILGCLSTGLWSTALRGRPGRPAA